MSRYTGIPKTTSPNGKKMYTTVRYPDVPRTFEDIYVYVGEGDRLDTLAVEYYGDSSLWWIISIANDNLQQNSLYLPVGRQLRIPPNPAPIIAAYEEINE